MADDGRAVYALVDKWRDQARETERLRAVFGHGIDAYGCLMARQAMTACADDLEAVLRDSSHVALNPKEQWRPIETAPKDGTIVLIYQPAGQWRPYRGIRGVVVCTGYWHQSGNAADSPGFWVGKAYTKKRPTHWMPLPEPPALSVDVPKS